MKSTTEIVEKFIQTNITQSAHTDELIEESFIKNKSDLFYHSIRYFNEVVAQIKEINPPTVQIDLYIELISKSNSIIGTPSDLPNLIEEIDDFGMPEIFIFKPEKIFWQPKKQMYVSPLTFKIDVIIDDVVNFYQEYRTMDEIIENIEFTRWLTFSYLKSTS